MTQKRIALHYGVSPQAVSDRYRTALSLLAKRLERPGADAGEDPTPQYVGTRNLKARAEARAGARGFVVE